MRCGSSFDARSRLGDSDVAHSWMAALIQLTVIIKYPYYSKATARDFDLMAPGIPSWARSGVHRNKPQGSDHGGKSHDVVTMEETESPTCNSVQLRTVKLNQRDA
jgi:hypothetical protein